MTKWPLHWYPREYINQKKQKEHKRKHSYLKEENTLQRKKKPQTTPSILTTKTKLTSLSEDAGDMLS